MSIYKASFCDPFQKEIIQLGDIPEGEIINRFEQVNWADYLQQMAIADAAAIYYSPGLEIERKDTAEAVAISAIENESGYEYYIFYKRPKSVNFFLG
jgi:hypothetical protein